MGNVIRASHFGLGFGADVELRWNGASYDVVADWHLDEGVDVDGQDYCEWQVKDIKRMEAEDAKAFAKQLAKELHGVVWDGTFYHYGEDDGFSAGLAHGRAGREFLMEGESSFERLLDSRWRLDGAYREGFMDGFREGAHEGADERACVWGQVKEALDGVAAA